ncbi:hypothetical protein ASE48_20150 [Mycobacterium sp. Root265]|uniref:DUF3631 domain-containing protein n=1 Tax=Mycobacterium sp. Root265 TaxID=1736504 RepID=UPI00070CF4DA|nr:DUF3631 domain-containing protein [Mycobacterium sp. Root265]KRD04955.1 hypothetical protein ASE48_20150 [Mycobacterium sp. Root265]
MTTDLLNEVDRMVNKYLAFQSPHHSTVIALWVLHTWVVNAFYVTPRLILDSAEPGSGKTRVLELLALLCRSAKLTLSTTTAALYRRIAAADDDGLPPPTVLQDEADAIFGKNSSPQAEDLRALFNAGYRKGATVDRCEGDAKNMRVREFPVHAPVALAGLAGKMPDTIKTRGITIHMRRRRPDQKVADFRERAALAEAAPIREQLDAWTKEHEERLASARPTLPSGVTDRSAEIWEPLIAIADLAGPDWARRSREACTFFVVDSAADDEKLSIGQRLLRDIQLLLEGENVDAMWSSDIIAKLTADAESEWRDLWGKPLDQRRLAKELNRYGVKSKSIRLGIATSKGYDVHGPTGLRQAWDHWLTPSVSGTSGTADTLQVGALRTVPDTSLSGTSGTQAARAFNAPEQVLHEVVPLVPDVPLPSGAQGAATSTLCPDCRRAPTRRDTGLCDFCTAKHRRQQTTKGQAKVSCQKWFDAHIADLRAAGETTAMSLLVYQAGQAQGYTRQQLRGAASANPDIVVIDRAGGTAKWSITGEGSAPYRSADDWVNDYLAALPLGAEVDKTAFRSAAGANGHSWTAARHAATESGRIESTRRGSETIWTLKSSDTDDGVSA